MGEWSVPVFASASLGPDCRTLQAMLNSRASVPVKIDDQIYLCGYLDFSECEE